MSEKAQFAADFETNTQEDDCRIWAWGVAEVGSEEVNVGTDMPGFLSFVRSNPGRYWFHNLAFDGKFIIDYLLKAGIEHTEGKPIGYSQFNTLIDGMGKFYRIQWGRDIEFTDSLKKIPMTIAGMAKTYGLTMSKGDIDYEEHREEGHELTEEERDYLERDVRILSLALAKRLEMGNKLTTGADCLANAKDLFGKKWANYFPPLNDKIDEDLRKAYRGGYVWVNPKHKGKVVGEGIRLDVNSLYPWAMYTGVMPVGNPRVGRGEPKPTSAYNLWIGEVSFTAHLKPGKLPCIQPKNNFLYGEREYITDTVQPLRMWFCSADWELICEMYDVDVYDWGTHYLFRSATGLFTDYIDTGMYGKEHAANPGERMNWKLWLNNLYGKFAQKIQVRGKVPELGPDGVVRYRAGTPETRDPVYLPVGIFTTAYARGKTIRTGCLFGERACYFDTDSIHAVGTDIPTEVDVHPTHLGAWKHEATFEKAKFLRCKTYSEVVDGKAEFTCAGMTSGIKEVCTFEDFEYGFTTDTRRLPQIYSRYDARLPYKGCEVFEPERQKLLPKAVPGGVVLVPAPFTIHR